MFISDSPLYRTPLEVITMCFDRKVSDSFARSASQLSNSSFVVLIDGTENRFPFPSIEHVQDRRNYQALDARRGSCTQSPSVLRNNQQS
jgi:hypothetical protein